MQAELGTIVRATGMRIVGPNCMGVVNVPRPAQRLLLLGRAPAAGWHLLTCPKVVATAEEALSAGREIGYPLVVKTARPDVLHRTEVGGVVLGMTDEGLAWAVRALEGRLGEGPLLIQEEGPRGIELLVGGRRDPSFGPTVLVGLGGVLAELLRDVSIELAPLTPGDARAMLAEGRRAALLRGFRGAVPVDEGALAAVLVAVGDLLVEHAEIAELDLNTLIASGGRLVAVDALIVVNPGTAETGRACDAT